MKLLLLILVVSVIIILFYFYKIYEEVNNMDMDIEVGSIDFSKFDTNNFFSSGSVIKTNINVYANNKGNVDVKFNNLVFGLYYDGVLIAKTSDNPVNSKTMVIVANSITPLSQEFNLYFNSNLINFISCVKTGSNCKLNYSINFKWYMLPIPTITGIIKLK